MVIVNITTMNLFGTPFAYTSKHHHTTKSQVEQEQSSISVSPVDPILCWIAGGIRVPSGVPISAVIAAGQTAHAADVCP